VKEGRSVLPEKSHTTERSGSPLAKQWDHGAEVFGAKARTTSTSRGRPASSP